MKFEKVKVKFEKKFPYMSILEYNGYYNNAKFLDKKFGEFYGSFQTVSAGTKRHPLRTKSKLKVNNFEKAKSKLQEKYQHYTLVSYSGYSKKCIVIDKIYGEFSGAYNNILVGKKIHSTRLHEKNKKKANQKIKNIFPYIKVLKYNGYIGLSKFLDEDFGIFTDKYINILSKGSPFRNKHKEKAKKSLKEKFEYLELLEYNGSKDSLFFDKKYGNFYAKFSKVISGSKKHPDRTKKNKYNSSQKKSVKNKRKNTCLERYGEITPLLNSNVKNKIKATNIERYGFAVPNKSEVIQKKIAKTKIKNGCAIDVNGLTPSQAIKKFDLQCSVQHFAKLVKIVGPDEAVNYSVKRTDIEFIIETILKKTSKNYIYNKYINNKKENRYRPDFLVDNLIIEADGLKFHSDLHQKDKFYHINKKNTYTNLGYKSLFFRSDEILNKTQIVKSIIHYNLNLIKNKYYANECNINILDSKTSNLWFYNNHLMGPGIGKTFSLEHKGVVVCAIRIINNKKHLKISRYCNLNNSIVDGGFSKLLKYIMKYYDKDKIIFLADLRYKDVRLLLKEGFVEDSTSLSFKWTDFNSTFSKTKYPNNSGYDNNLYKIWDCGHKKLILER